MPDIQDLTHLHGNTIDILVYLFQCRMNAKKVPPDNFLLRYCVKLDSGLALEINKLKELPYADHTLIDSITTAVSALQKTPETKQLGASYAKQLEALVSTNKKILADYHQQLEKGEELRAQQDEFFAQSVVPTLGDNHDSSH